MSLTQIARRVGDDSPRVALAVRDMVSTSSTIGPSFIVAGLDDEFGNGLKLTSKVVQNGLPVCMYIPVSFRKVAT
jgi:hypothetical protein